MKEKIKNFLKFTFYFLKNEQLEKKAWFRLLKVLHIVVYILLIFVAIIVLVFLYEDQTLINADVLCKDGTKWSAMGNGELLPSTALCGLCTQRSEDGLKFKPCSYLNLDYSSYNIINQQYKHNTPFYGIIGLPLVIFLISLVFVKVLFIGLVYIISGSAKIY